MNCVLSSLGVLPIRGGDSHIVHSVKNRSILHCYHLILFPISGFLYGSDILPFSLSLNISPAGQLGNIIVLFLSPPYFLTLHHTQRFKITLPGLNPNGKKRKYGIEKKKKRNNKLMPVGFLSLCCLSFPTPPLFGRPPGCPFRSSRLAAWKPVLRLLSLPLSYFSPTTPSLPLTHTPLSVYSSSLDPILCSSP